MGIASACAENPYDYPVGERHAFNLFIAEPSNAEPNQEEAIDKLGCECWSKVELKKTGVIDRNSATKTEGPFLEMYDEAIDLGHSLLVYADVES